MNHHSAWSMSVVLNHWGGARAAMCTFRQDGLDVVSAVHTSRGCSRGPCHAWALSDSHTACANLFRSQSPWVALCEVHRNPNVNGLTSLLILKCCVWTFRVVHRALGFAFAIDPLTADLLGDVGQLYTKQLNVIDDRGVGVGQRPPPHCQVYSR